MQVSALPSLPSSVRQSQASSVSRDPRLCPSAQWDCLTLRLSPPGAQVLQKLGLLVSASSFRHHGSVLPVLKTVVQQEASPSWLEVEVPVAHDFDAFRMWQ